HTVLPRAVGQIKIACLSAGWEIELVKPAGMNGHVVAPFESVSSSNFNNPPPKSWRTPWTQGVGQDAAPPHAARCNKGRCLPPETQPPSAAEEFRQKLHAVIA